MLKIKEFDKVRMGLFIYFFGTNILLVIASILGGLKLLNANENYDYSLIAVAPSFLVFRILFRALNCLFDDDETYCIPFKILAGFSLIFFWEYWFLGIIINPDPKICGVSFIIVAIFSSIMIPLFYFRRRKIYG